MMIGQVEEDDVTGKRSVGLLMVASTGQHCARNGTAEHLQKEWNPLLRFEATGRREATKMRPSRNQSAFSDPDFVERALWLNRVWRWRRCVTHVHHASVLSVALWIGPFLSVRDRCLTMGD